MHDTQLFSPLSVMDVDLALHPKTWLTQCIAGSCTNIACLAKVQCHCCSSEYQHWTLRKHKPSPTHTDKHTSGNTNIHARKCKLNKVAYKKVLVILFQFNWNCSFYSRKRGALNSSLAAIVVVGPRPVVYRHDLQLNYSSKVCIGVVFLWFPRVLRLEWQ